MYWKYNIKMNSIQYVSLNIEHLRASLPNPQKHRLAFKISIVKLVMGIQWVTGRLTADNPGDNPTKPKLLFYGQYKSLKDKSISAGNNVIVGKTMSGRTPVSNLCLDSLPVWSYNCPNCKIRNAHNLHVCKMAIFL
jgi:hypothetical protein